MVKKLTRWEKAAQTRRARAAAAKLTPETIQAAAINAARGLYQQVKTTAPEKAKLNRAQLAQHVGQLISQDRQETHGDPHRQFALAQSLKAIIDAEAAREFTHLGNTEHEALEQIMTKVSRIICGSNLQDAWLDIAGYALIAAERGTRPLCEVTK